MATSTAKTYTPNQLAKHLDISPKQLRAYLRANHARPADAKGTSWVINAATAKKVLVHFTPSK